MKTLHNNYCNSKQGYLPLFLSDCLDLLDPVLTFEAEGVVEMTLQACHTYNIEAKSIEKRVKEKGLPYIHIETDYSQADVGQLDTRIAAFLEMI